MIVIKWRYHYARSKPTEPQELEIPDHVNGDREIAEYLDEMAEGLGICTQSWSYSPKNFSWVEVKLTPEEIKQRKIRNLERELAYIKRGLENVEKELEVARNS